MRNGENRYFDENQVGTKEKAIIGHKDFCISHGVVPLPLLFSNIEGTTLALFGYNIGSQASGIQSILKSLPSKSMVIEVLVLNNCNLKDEGFAMILEGLIHQDCLSSITYTKDEFGPKSMEQLEIIRNLEA